MLRLLVGLRSNSVESLSPHRVLAADVERPVSEVEGEKSDADGQYENMLMENLRQPGVQNTFKNERLKFDRLEAFAGEWLQASGEYTDAAGKVGVRQCPSARNTEP
jgi:adenine-specific DNA-methyltransferase